jgi:predicted transcriptional regulator
MKLNKTLKKAGEKMMQTIWQLDPCLLKDIIDQLNNPEISPNTVSSVVRILEKKGFLNHKGYT